MSLPLRLLRPFARSPLLTTPRSSLPKPFLSSFTRSYATPTRRPADPANNPDNVEQGSEDLAGSDPNMDPGMNGNYPDPSKTSALALKRQFRDPYGVDGKAWWDPQERRMYGEAVHEDNDILGIFSPDVYTHATPGWAAVQVACFVGAFCTLLAVVSRFYPDIPAVPRTFAGGLETELGGPKTMVALRSEGEESVLD
nr:hypothetical protein B0A51_02103 [Rachicladosporium sp. CCFEE 5018]